MGVWIETFRVAHSEKWVDVTPFVGVWIETKVSQRDETKSVRHTLRGCVD